MEFSTFVPILNTVKNPSLYILQTCFSHSWGGLELQALEMSTRLHTRGHVVWMACCGGSRLESEARDAGIPTFPLDIRGYFHPRYAWRLGRFIKEKGFDIIHCQQSKDIASVVPAMNFSRQRIPLVLSKRVGSYLIKKDIFHRYTHAHIDRVLAVSEVIRKNVIDTTPVPAERVTTLHDGIDIGMFSLQRADRLKVRSEFGYEPQQIVIGFVGRFSPGKGHEEFLEAGSILRKVYPDVRFSVVGEASHGEERYEQKIRTLCSVLGLDGEVTFTGFRRDIPDVMAAFDIFVFPSHAESFGVVLIEAMAMERPVVSTNCDGVLDIVVDETTGLYVDPRNAKQLAAAIGRLIRHPQLRESMGKAGRRRVEELFDQKLQMDRVEEIYRELLGMAAVNPAATPAQVTSQRPGGSAR